MAITKDQLKTLNARAYMDKDFREALLDPDKTQKTAAQLKIRLSKQEVQMIQDCRDEIIANGKRIQPHAKSMFLPFIGLKPTK
jgi:hypothetical protein